MTFVSHLIFLALALAPCDAMTLSVTALYSLGQDNVNNVQHNSFGHKMPLLLVSYHIRSVISGTLLFV